MLRGWPVMAHETHTRRRRRTEMLKYPSLVRIHTRRRLRHSFVASLITLCSKPRQTSNIILLQSVHQRHELSSGLAAATFLPNGLAADLLLSSTVKKIWKLITFPEVFSLPKTRAACFFTHSVDITVAISRLFTRTNTPNTSQNALVNSQPACNLVENPSKNDLNLCNICSILFFINLLSKYFRFCISFFVETSVFVIIFYFRWLAEWS